MAQRSGDESIIHTGLRYAGCLFIYALPRNGKFLTENEHFINHSEEASLLYHCGTLFALRTIFPGDEMTVNYKYYLAADDITSFRDAWSGGPVQGLGNYRALQASALELAALLSSEDNSKSLAYPSSVVDIETWDWRDRTQHRLSSAEDPAQLSDTRMRA